MIGPLKNVWIIFLFRVVLREVWFNFDEKISGVKNTVAETLYPALLF